MRGITIKLHTKTETGRDPFGAPIYSDDVIDVDNVLIGEPTASDIVDELTISGKRLAYTLAIPKGDSNSWDDVVVEFFGQKFRTYGEATEGIEALIPLSWNKKVKVERYG